MSDLRVSLPSKRNNCSICGIGSVTSTCLECNEHLCKYCTTAHQRSKTTTSHKIVSEELKPWNTFPDKNKKVKNCKMHSKELNNYCSTCSLFVCEDCIQFIHQKHNFGKIDEMAKETKNVIFESLLQLKEIHVVKIKSKLTKTAKYREEFDLHSKRIHECIKQRTKELEVEIRKIRDVLTNEFQKLQKENEQVLHDIEKDLKKQMFDIEKMSDAFIEILNSAPSKDLLSAEHRIHRKIQNTVSRIRFNPAVHLSHFISGNHAEETLKTSFGFIRRGEDFSSEFEESSDNRQPPFKCSVVSVFNHKSGDIMSLCPVNENEAWVHRKNENQNHYVDMYGTVKKTIDFDFFIDDFAYTEDGDVLCSTYGGQSIVHVFKDGSFKEVVKTFPLHPRGLCVTRNKGILVCLMDDYTYDVTDTSKRCVVEMAGDGATINQMEFDKSGKRIFTVPYRVVENTNHDVCVIDRISDTTGRLVVLSVKGILRFTYNNNNSCHFIPNGVTCDKKGRIIVSDFWDKLHILDCDGTFLQYLISEENKIEYPQSIGIDPSGRLWVGCERGNIYILSYEESELTSL